jgi:hypothetical protein
MKLRSTQSPSTEQLVHTGGEQQNSAKRDKNWKKKMEKVVLGRFSIVLAYL